MDGSTELQIFPCCLPCPQTLPSKWIEDVASYRHDNFAHETCKLFRVRLLERENIPVNLSFHLHLHMLAVPNSLSC